MSEAGSAGSVAANTDCRAQGRQAFIESKGSESVWQKVAVIVGDGQFALFESLLGEAFEGLRGALPTVVTAESLDAAADRTTGMYEMPFCWPKRLASSSSELGAAASEQLAAGPVLLVPPWGRRAGRGNQLTRNEHEIILLDCIPAGPDALLAVLLPASTWVSPQARLVREELAKRWKPVLVIYASGVLPGIHSAFQLSMAFLRPRDAEGESLLRVFQIPREPDDSAVGRDFSRLLKRKGGRGEFGYVLRDVPALVRAWRLIAMTPRWPPGEPSCQYWGLP